MERENVANEEQSLRVYPKFGPWPLSSLNPQLDGSELLACPASLHWA